MIIDEYGYTVSFVHGQQGAGKKRRVLVAWKDYSYRDDTWERPDDVYPKCLDPVFFVGVFFLLSPFFGCTPVSWPKLLLVLDTFTPYR